MLGVSGNFKVYKSQFYEIPQEYYIANNVFMENWKEHMHEYFPRKFYRVLYNNGLLFYNDFHKRYQITANDFKNAFPYFNNLVLNPFNNVETGVAPFVSKNDSVNGAWNPEIFYEEENDRWVGSLAGPNIINAPEDFCTCQTSLLQYNFPKGNLETVPSGGLFKYSKIYTNALWAPKVINSTDITFDDLTPENYGKTITFESLAYPNYNNRRNYYFYYDVNTWLRIPDCPDYDYENEPEKYDEMCGVYIHTSRVYNLSNSSSNKDIQILIGSVVLGSDDEKDGRYIGIDHSYSQTQDPRYYQKEFYNYFYAFDPSFKSYVGTFKIYGGTFNLETPRWLLKFNKTITNFEFPFDETFLIVEAPSYKEITLDLIKEDAWEIQDEAVKESYYADVFKIPNWKTSYSAPGIEEVTFYNPKRDNTIKLKILGLSRRNPFQVLGSYTGQGDGRDDDYGPGQSLSGMQKQMNTYIR